MTEKSVIVFEHVSFSYFNLPVLEDINLAVKEKDFICIVGPNAGGKTTLLKLILGLLKPTKGSVKVFGEPPEKTRSRIGYMPQHISFDPLFPVSAFDVVLMGRLNPNRGFGFYTHTDRDAAANALKSMEMYEVRHQMFFSLSGGQRQRVLIARALVSDPEILLLDEPTSHVDIAAGTELYDILGQLNKKITIVLVTHDIGFVSRYVKSVVCVNRRVVVHPTNEITGEMINDIYGCDVHMVRHDHVTGKEPV
jgi:zinc transport system ATP-binding protein